MACEVKCANCPFGGARVSTKGSPDAPMIIVGESPGPQEVREGEPFVGSSGRVLHDTIPFDPDKMFVTNALFCNPPRQLKKDTSRVSRAITACQPRLLESIQRDTEHLPKIIIALGNYALWSLTGNHNLKITQVRGQLVPSNLSVYGILPVIHPAALMRGTGSYRQFKEDLLYAQHLANGGHPKQYTHTKWKGVHTMAECYYALKDLSKYSELTADIETTGFNPSTCRILSIGVKGGGYAPDQPTRAYCFRGTLKRRLWTILTNPKIKWCWHNGKFDISFLREIGIEARVDDDTMLMSYCLDENPGVHDLEQIANELLGAPDYKDMLTKYVGTGKNKKSYAAVPEPVLDEYLAYDVDNTHQIRKVYRERIAADPIAEKLYTKTLIPASELLYHIERRGMYLDQERLAENDIYYKEEIARVRSELRDICGYEINPNSPKQLKELLFEKWKIPNKRKGSTDEKTLKALLQMPRYWRDARIQQAHGEMVTSFIKKLMEHRKIAKQHGTYVKPMLGHLWPDGRIHTTYKLHGTPTGRLASSKPNLQNIPRLPRLRGQFTAPPGYIIVEVDLSQAELRSLAQLSGDVEMCRIYNDNSTSLHKEVALAMFGKGYNKDQYVRAKAVNFGIVYGRTAHTLAEEFNVPVSEGQRMIDAWFERFPQARDYIMKCRATPNLMQTMVTCFGRRKRHGIVCPGNITELQNQSANFPHQSIASDITLTAAIRVRPKLIARGYDANIINLVHDSIMVEVRDEEKLINEVALLVKAEMESIAPEKGLTRVPFLADCAKGKRWGYLEEFEPYAT